MGRYIVPTGQSAAPRPTGPSQIYSVILKEHLPDPTACHESSSIEPTIEPFLNSPDDVFATAQCRAGNGIALSFSLIHSTAWMKLPFAKLAAADRVALSEALRPRIEHLLGHVAPGGDAGETTCETQSQEAGSTVGVADFWSPNGDVAHVESPGQAADTAGWVLCTSRGSGWLMAWTDKDTNILSVATGPDLASLYGYWKSSAGPRSGSMG